MRQINNLVLLILVVIILLGSFLRVFKIAEFPVQLNHDEISQIYDAISIAQTSKDIYGNFMPTIFTSVHDFKSPFYTYATVAAYFIFGNHEWIIRVPGVLFGLLLIPAVFLFTLKLIGNINIALLASFITAISPAEVFFSRKSFENGAGNFFMILGFYFLLTFLETKNKMRWLYLSTFLIVVGMYTYFSHAVIIPFLTILFILIFKKKFTLPFKKYFGALLLLVILVTPLMLIIITNPGSRYRSQTVFVTQDVNLGTQSNYINTDISILSTFLKAKTLIDYSFNRYLIQFNPGYLFAEGLDLTNQGPINSGPLLLFQLPFLLFGLIYLIKTPNLENQKLFIMAWVLVGVLPSGLTFEYHSPHRIIMVFTMLNIITGIGIFWLWRQLVRSSLLKPVFGLIGIILIWNLTYFLNIYFVNFPYEKSEQIHYPFKEIGLFAKSQRNNYDQIIFDPLFGEIAPTIGTGAHYYLAYYTDYSPANFQKTYQIGKKEREVIFDKFSIRKVDWGEDKNLKKTLIIASKWSLPIDSIDKSKIIKTFYFYNKKEAFYAVDLKNDNE